MDEEGLVVSYWDTGSAPPRRVYWVTEEGHQWLPRGQP